MNKQPQNAVGLGPDYMIPELIDQKEAIVIPEWTESKHSYDPPPPCEVSGMTRRYCTLCPSVSVSVSGCLASIFASVGVNDDGDLFQQETLEQCADAVLPLLAAKLEEALVVLREMIRVNERKES